VRLLGLYRAALGLPPPWSEDFEGGTDIERLSDEEWRRAKNAAGRLPIDLYSEVFNSTVVPAEEPVAGSVSDDLADIHRDVRTGLRAYEAGTRAAAVWEWSFGLHSHWGSHATSAVRTLHWWLVENAIERLSSGTNGAG
jgi:hypothetical protein